MKPQPTKQPPTTPVDKGTQVDKKVKNIERQKLDTDIEHAFDDLFLPKKAPHQVPEHVFQKFLPFFAGKVRDDENLNITTTWVAIAGSPTNPVDVTDAGGNKIFTVPPLMSSDFIKSGENTPGSKRFSQIAQEAQLQANRLPVLGEKLLTAQGTEKIRQMNAKPNGEYISEWNHIFERYGIEQPKTPTGKSINEQKSDGSDELDFD